MYFETKELVSIKGGKELLAGTSTTATALCYRRILHMTHDVLRTTLPKACDGQTACALKFSISFMPFFSPWLTDKSTSRRRRGSSSASADGRRVYRSIHRMVLIGNLIGIPAPFLRLA